MLHIVCFKSLLTTRTCTAQSVWW